MKIELLYFGLEYARWNSTIRDRLVQQNANAIHHFLKPYGDEILEQTGKTLPEYLDDVFDSLASPYEDVELTDSKYDTAQNILESLRAIRSVNICFVFFAEIIT